MTSVQVNVANKRIQPTLPSATRLKRVLLSISHLLRSGLHPHFTHRWNFEKPWRGGDSFVTGWTYGVPAGRPPAA